MNTGSAHACGVLHGWAGLPLLALGGFHWIHSPWVSVARVARTATLPRPNPWNASLAASSLQTTSPSPGWCPKSKPGNGAFRSCGPVGDLYNTFLLKESKKRNGSQMLLSCLYSQTTPSLVALVLGRVAEGQPFTRAHLNKHKPAGCVSHSQD